MDNYCRILGHHIPFKYCRTSNNGIPCAKILDCNFERLPIKEFVDSNYTDEEKEMIFAPVKQKIVSIYELIEKAKNR
ncbi:hypothetical protein KKA14_00730 [bacterium]|nr:hypothetical protein [bacterium]